MVNRPSIDAKTEIEDDPPEPVIEGDLSTVSFEEPDITIPLGLDDNLTHRYQVFPEAVSIRRIRSDVVNDIEISVQFRGNFERSHSRRKHRRKLTGS